MPDFNPFDMDFDGDVDRIDFLGFDYLTRRVLRPDEDEQDDDDQPYCRATVGNNQEGVDGGKGQVLQQVRA